MDIAGQSMEVRQSRVQQHTDIVETTTAIDTGVKKNNQMTEKPHNDAIDPNVGHNLDVIADNQIDKKEELHKQLQQEIKWAQDKQKLLNLKEVKLLQMREIAQQGKQVVITPQQLRNLNHRLDKLASQVSAIDSDSRRTKGGEKLE